MLLSGANSNLLFNATKTIIKYFECNSNRWTYSQTEYILDEAKIHFYVDYIKGILQPEELKVSVAHFVILLPWNLLNKSSILISYFGTG